MASVGQISKQAASSHCTQVTGTEMTSSSFSTLITLTAEFSQTDSHVPQSLHFLGEINKSLFIFDRVAA
jgi:hypothetical protein